MILLKLMLITNDEEAAIRAENAGINRIFIDLEQNGKLERQGHLDTHIGDHEIQDVGKIKKVLKRSKVLVRINPYYAETPKEIEECLIQGADIIMLPMFTTKEEVENFIKHVGGRAKTSLLLETSQALVRIDDILKIDGIDEIHIGLNDLHISLGLDFMFEVLAGEVVDYIAPKIRDAGITFGFGGIAKIGEGDVPSEIIIGEHYRLGSEIVILSRAFRNESNTKTKGTEFKLSKEVTKIRAVENDINTWEEDQYNLNKNRLKKKVKIVAKKIKSDQKKHVL